LGVTIEVSAEFKLQRCALAQARVGLLGHTHALHVACRRQLPHACAWCRQHQPIRACPARTAGP
jgi:hypothetical protein